MNNKMNFSGLNYALQYSGKYVALPIVFAGVLAGCTAETGPSSASVMAMVSSSAPVASSVAVVSSVAAVSSSAPQSSSVASVTASSASSSPAVVIPANAKLVYAINAGGPLLNLGGVEYKADRFSTGGTSNPTTKAIDGTTNDALYQTERYGAYKYEVPVTNSSYSLKLHFAELYQTAAASRYFSVTVEGQTIFTDKDLYAEIGAAKAWDVVIPNVMVADEKLTIELTASIDNGTLSGFAIYSNTGGQFVEPPIVECALPSTFKWTSSPSLIKPPTINGKASYGIKDPSIVKYDGKYHVFATINDDDWKSVYLSFTDFDSIGSAKIVPMSGTSGGNTVAPQVFFYRPHNKWYNITQWPRGYNTTTNISDINSWTPRKDFLTNGPKTQPGENELDYWVICDDNNCHLFFALDNGKLYHSKTTRANFPNFNGYDIVVQSAPGEPKSMVFEASNVYKVDGTDQYLMLIEAYNNGPRFFRSFTSTSLDGPWVKLADTERNPFAGNYNVEWPDVNYNQQQLGVKGWSNGVSHGEMIRSGYDEYMTIDPCNLEFLFQGETGGPIKAGNYGTIPYHLGLLKLKK